MPKIRKVVTALLISIAMGATPTPAAAADPPVPGSCADGDFRWTARDGAITTTRALLTFTSVGRLRGCTGIPGITGGTFAGMHVAWSDCLHPADGPLTVEITWSNGETSTLRGPWPVGMAQPADGPLDVADGLGRGGRVRVVASYEMARPDMVMDCLGSGVKTGVGRLSAHTL